MAGDVDIAEELNKAAGGGARLSDFDGQTITVVSIVKEASPFEKGGTSVKATALTSEGEEVVFYTTPTAGRQLIKAEELEILPLELKVVSFPGQFGKTGYKFELA